MRILSTLFVVVVTLCPVTHATIYLDQEAPGNSDGFDFAPITADAFYLAADITVIGSMDYCGFDTYADGLKQMWVGIGKESTHEGEGMMMGVSGFGGFPADFMTPNLSSYIPETGNTYRLTIKVDKINQQVSTWLGTFSEGTAPDYVGPLLDDHSADFYGDIDRVQFWFQGGGGNGALANVIITDSVADLLPPTLPRAAILDVTQSGEELTITWSSELGKKYTLVSTEDIADSQNMMVVEPYTNIPGTDAPLSATTTVTGAEVTYYGIRENALAPNFAEDVERGAAGWTTDVNGTAGVDTHPPAGGSPAGIGKGR